MHILISILHRPSKPTGVCRHAANLAQCLADTDEVTQVTLIVGIWQKSYFESSFGLFNKKIKLLYIDIENRSYIRNYWYLFELPKLANSLQPDLVHLSFPTPFFRFLFSSPVVATIHDLYPYEHPEVFGYPNVLFNRLFLKQCAANSDGIVCVSKSTLESVKFYFPKIVRQKPVDVVYNYVDFGNVEPKSPSQINIANDGSFLLSVAQHRKHKNLDLLIQAFDLLLKSGSLQPATKLIIVGNTGPETEPLHSQIAALSLPERVLLVSSLEDGEMRWLYQNCKLLVVPSAQEGFCLPLTEALYLSCKVVCSDIPVLREIGSSDCTYFSLQGDRIKNLSEAIVLSLKEPCHQNPAHFRFSKEKAANQYLEFYSTIK